MKEADPEYIRQMEEKKRIKAEEQMEKERKRQEWTNKQRKKIRAELVEAAKTDPEAAVQLAELKAKEKEKRELKKAERQRRMQEDLEYAEQLKQRNLEYSRRHAEQRKQERQELKQRTAAKLEEIQQYNREAAKKSQRKMYEQAMSGDPEAIRRLENFRKSRGDSYHAKKEEVAV